MDLYPRQFDESYPLPSFNTRDLDTVDNGCLERLPSLLKNFRGIGKKEHFGELEVIVSHFLGVDHVGHTYGPHDKHMANKLNQIDAALSTTLDVIDSSQNCHLVLIFGGMFIFYFISSHCIIFRERLTCKEKCPLSFT